MRGGVVLLALWAILSPGWALVTRPLVEQTPQEKLEALIDAGLPPQILIATDVEKGDSESLKKVSETVIEGLREIGITATVGFYLHMLAMFTLYASNLQDGLAILDFLETHDHITNYEVDTITFPNPSSEDDLMDDIPFDENNIPPLPAISDVPVLVAADHDDDDTTTAADAEASSHLRH